MTDTLARPESARSRHSGHHAAARHHGVAHSHRSPASHHTSTHHRGGHPAQHHTATARRARLLTERGTVNSYDAPSNTAMVQLVGTLARLIGPIAVSLGVPTGSLSGKNCLVVLLDGANVADGVVVAAW